MRAETTSFFATRADLEPGLKAAEEQRPLRYVLAGLFQSSVLTAFSSALDIPGLGLAQHGQSLGENRYLVTDAGTPVRVRPVPQRRGGVLYAVDTVWNPSGILFRPGGVLEDRCLISGEIIGVGDPGSLELYRAITRPVLKEFVRIQAFYVGTEAVRLLDAGMRLTQDVRAPGSYDLKRPEHPQRKADLPSFRLTLEDSWKYLKAQGFEVPEDENQRPFVPGHVPNYDDTLLGLSFFRTRLEDEPLANLTMPRTYFSHSEFREVSFRNTDLSESRMCWNDWIACDFTEADLTRTDLRASEYVRCCFAAADLIQADLRRSNFQECDFSGARMRGARLTRQQEAGLMLTRSQRLEIDWQNEDGPEPSGG